jgi:CBS domain-containing protein
MNDNYVSGHTFTQATQAYKQMTNMDTTEEIFHVSQLMSWPVITINDNQSIYECWELMKEHDIKQIPVIGSHGKLKGMATVKKLSNVLMENLNNEQYIKAAFVDVIMKHNIITANPISDIRRVSKMMVINHLNCLPVVNENDKIVGIISRADILRTIEENPHIRLWG